MVKEKTRAEWERLLTAAGVPHAPVWDYAQMFAHPQVAARNMRITVTRPDGVPVDLIGSPLHVSGAALPSPTPPPDLGQDTHAVLKGLLGLSPEEVAALKERGVV